MRFQPKRHVCKLHSTLERFECTRLCQNGEKFHDHLFAGCFSVPCQADLIESISGICANSSRCTRKSGPAFSPHVHDHTIVHRRLDQEMCQSSRSGGLLEPIGWDQSGTEHHYIATPCPSKIHVQDALGIKTIYLHNKTATAHKITL